MGKFKATPGLQSMQSAGAYTAGKSSSDQCERLIAIRLHTATNLEVDRDASLAWNDRRIIRARMEYYTSTQSKVLN